MSGIVRLVLVAFDGTMPCMQKRGDHCSLQYNAGNDREWWSFFEDICSLAIFYGGPERESPAFCDLVEGVAEIRRGVTTCQGRRPSWHRHIVHDGEFGFLDVGTWKRVDLWYKRALEPVGV